MNDLSRVEIYAGHVLTDAQSLRRAVRMLKTQPSFETRAHDVLKTAEAELVQCLDETRQALRDYEEKPTV